MVYVKSLAALILRCLVFGCLAFTNNYLSQHITFATEHSVDKSQYPPNQEEIPPRLQDSLYISSIRRNIITVQYSIICLACLVCTLCHFVFTTIRSSRRYRVILKSPQDNASDQPASATSPETSLKIEDVHDDNIDHNNDAFDDIDDILHEIDPDAEVPIVSIPRTAGTRQYIPIKYIRNLIVDANVLGIIIWGTIYSMDFSIMDHNLCLLSGMFTGWVWSGRPSNLSKVCWILYIFQISSLISLPLQLCSQLIPTISESFNHLMTMFSFYSLLRYIAAIGVGLTWTTYFHRQNIRIHLSDTAFTCALLSWAQMASLNLKNLQIEITPNSSNDLTLLFVVEPILKFMAVYLIHISIQDGKGLELIITMVIVANIRLLATYGSVLCVDCLCASPVIFYCLLTLTCTLFIFYSLNLFQIFYQN